MHLTNPTNCKNHFNSCKASNLLVLHNTQNRMRIKNNHKKQNFKHNKEYPPAQLSDQALLSNILGFPHPAIAYTPLQNKQIKLNFKILMKNWLKTKRISRVTDVNPLGKKKDDF